MQFNDPATGFTTGTDEPDLDVMRYATQVAAKRQQPQAEMRAIPQSSFEKIVGAFGKGAESLGKTMAEPLAETQKVAPIKTWLAKTLVTDPLQGAGTALQDWSGTPRDATPEHPYTPSPFYGGSKATLNPNTWGPALQTFKTDPRVLDVAGVAQPAGALAKATATKVAAPVARMAGEALTQRMLAGESMIPGVSQAVAPNPLMFAVKPKGGNWAPPQGTKDSVESALSVLKSRGPTHRDEALMAGGDWTHMVDTPEGKHSLEVNGAVNRWIDKKLTPYVRNEMGTPDDPIRLAHEKGYTHIPGNQAEEFGSWLPEDTASARRKAGFPEEGFAVQKHAEAGYPEAMEANTRKAESWENLADTEITQSPAAAYQDQFRIARDFPSTVGNAKGALQIAERNPWLEKLDPKTPIYKIDMPMSLNENLGFNHMIDELVNSLDPASGLPANLRLTPKQLDKVSVEQAVERVHKINEWRNTEAEKAERAGMMSNLSANARLEDPTTKLSFVDKPGMKWIDIPETTDKKGMQLCTTIGKQGGWCTQGESLAKSYGSGDRRLTALIDAEGRPHVQVMTDYSPEGKMFSNPFNRLPDSTRAELMKEVQSITGIEGWPSHGKAFDRQKQVLDELMQRPEIQSQIKDFPEPPKNIAELKPVGNEFTSARAREYDKRDPQYRPKITESVLKFLNSGNWGRVNDLDHYDIVDMNSPQSVQRMLEDVLGDYHLSSERAALFNNAVDLNPNAPRFMSRNQFSEFVTPPPAPAPAKEHKMLQGFYRGYAGENTQTPELFVSPQKRIADYYAQKRAEQTGGAPHAEMILADPFAGKTYGHGTMGTGKNPPMTTRAKKLKQEDVKSSTQLYAKGGSVRFAKSVDDMRYELTRKK